MVVMQARQNAEHVAVEDGVRQVEGNARHRRSRIVAHPGKRADRPVIRWESALSRDLARGRMQIARARIIAQAAPAGQHLLQRSRCQGRYRGETLQELVVVRDYGLGAGLLQHDLRDPDLVGIASTAPRQVAATPVIPRTQSTPENGWGNQSRVRIHSAITAQPLGREFKSLKLRIERLQANGLVLPLILAAVDLTARVFLNRVAGAVVQLAQELDQHDLVLPRAHHGRAKHIQAAVRNPRLHGAAHHVRHEQIFGRAEILGNAASSLPRPPAYPRRSGWRPRATNKEAGAYETAGRQALRHAAQTAGPACSERRPRARSPDRRCAEHAKANPRASAETGRRPSPPHGSARSSSRCRGTPVRPAPAISSQCPRIRTNNRSAAGSRNKTPAFVGRPRQSQPEHRVFAPPGVDRDNSGGHLVFYVLIGRGKNEGS